MSEQQDPRLVKALQTISQLQQALQGKRMELTATAQVEREKLASNEKVKFAQLSVDDKRISGDLAIREAETRIEGAKLALEKLAMDLEQSGASQEQQGKVMQLMASLEQARMKLEEQKLKNQGAAIKLLQEQKKLEAPQTVQ